MGVPSAEDLIKLSVPERILQVRRGLELSQPAFGKKLGVTDRAVKRWESGDNAPTKRNATKIGALAGLDEALFVPSEEEISDLRKVSQRLTRLEAGREEDRRLLLSIAGALGVPVLEVPPEDAEPAI